MATFHPIKNKILQTGQKDLKKAEKLWQTLGPGLITGASDDDPSGVATYTQAGSGFGLATLWTALITFPMMAAVQEMSGRIGLVTHRGIASVIKKYYSKYLLYFVALLTVPACILNIGADLAGMGAVSHLLIPQVPSNLFVFLFAILIPASIVFFSYKSLEKIMKWLTLVLLSYFVVPFLVSQNLVEVFKATIIPQFQFSKEFISIFVALLGTTISPYLFFWEASQEVEEHELQSELHHHDPNKIGRGEIKQMRKDNLIGMFFSNLAMYFIILTAAVVLFKNGLTEISTVDQAAQALKPLAGDWAYFLFSIGVIGTGFLAIPVLAGACSYLLTETFNLPKGINKKFHEAKSFYFIIIISVLLGLGMNVLQIDPVQALIFTAIVYGVIAPILIGVILHICNNPKIMGIHKNGWLSNTFSILGLLLMSVAAIALLWTTFL